MGRGRREWKGQGRGGGPEGKRGEEGSNMKGKGGKEERSEREGREAGGKEGRSAREGTPGYIWLHLVIIVDDKVQVLTNHSYRDILQGMGGGGEGRASQLMEARACMIP